MSYLTDEQLAATGVTFGAGVRVSVDARIFGADRVVLGDNVRIDAFCVCSAGESGSLHLGSHIHIAAGARLFGQGGIEMMDFTSVSSGSTLYSASDDYSGEHLMGPTIPDRWTLVDLRPVILERYAAIGAHSLVLPGVRLGEGAVLGASSLAANELDPWTIYAGTPCRALRVRSRSLVEKASEFLESWRPDV